MIGRAARGVSLRDCYRKILGSSGGKSNRRPDMKRVRSSLLNLAAGWLLVFAWLAAMPGLLPEVFAALASFEGSHDVSIRVGAHSTAVLLGHQGSTAGVSHESIHHHGKLASMLCTIAGDHSNDPDHEAMFEGGAEADELRQTLVNIDSAVGPAIPPLHIICVLTDAEVFAVPFVYRGELLAHAPPSQFRGLGSTLLLI